MPTTVFETQGSSRKKGSATSLIIEAVYAAEKAFTHWITSSILYGCCSFYTSFCASPQNESPTDWDNYSPITLSFRALIFHKRKNPKNTLQEKLHISEPWENISIFSRFWGMELFLKGVLCIFGFFRFWKIYCSKTKGYRGIMISIRWTFIFGEKHRG